MEKTTKIVLWSVGGLAVATGLFFAIRALLPKKNDDEVIDKDNYMRLLEKELKGELSDKEREELERLRETTISPGPDEVGGSKKCPSSFGNNSKGICVAKMQLAINEKHDNTWSGDGVGGDIDYPCEKSGSDLAVDGQMGPKTMIAINKFYPSDRLCVRKNVVACHCIGSISKSTYNRIISGADTSNEALRAAGYDFGPGEKEFNQFSGNTGYSNFTLSNKTQLRGEGAMEWRTMQGVMGDFYKTSDGFIPNPVVPTNLQISYGMRNFGGDVSGRLPKLDLYGRKL